MSDTNEVPRHIVEEHKAKVDYEAAQRLAAERQAFIDETARMRLDTLMGNKLYGDKAAIRAFTIAAYNAAEALWAERERRRTGEKP